MRSILRLSIIPAACLCLATAGLAAQDAAPGASKQDPAKQADQDKDKDQDKDQKTNSDESRDPAANLSRPGKSEASGDKERGPGQQTQGALKDMDPSDPETRAMRKMMLEEAKYRKRLGMIKRLRELAEQQNNSERLLALNVLERKMTQLHERKIRRARAQLSQAMLKRADERIKKGRERTVKADKAQGAGALKGRRNTGRRDGPGNRPRASSGGEPDTTDSDDADRQPGKPKTNDPPKGKPDKEKPDKSKKEKDDDE